MEEQTCSSDGVLDLCNFRLVVVHQKEVHLIEQLTGIVIVWLIFALVDDLRYAVGNNNE